MRKQSLFSLILAIILVVTSSPFTAHAGEFAFNPNNIISDADFFNASTMDEAGIQAFLEAKGSYLATWKDPLTRMAPARIIHSTAQQYGINPQVILATIQKEQSAIENGGEVLTRFVLDKIMGYAFCDACTRDQINPDLLGFFNQVKYGTAIMDKYKREILETGKTRSGYGPNVPVTVDGQVVIPENIATAALYTYTPHIHGNSNFFDIWNRWFSLAYPDGTLLQAIGEPGVYVVDGGRRRGFQSLAALTTRGFNPGRVIQIESDELNKYPIGTPIKYPQYALFEGPDGSKYLYVNDTKRLIEDDETFRVLGFNPEEIDELPQEELDLIPDGKVITINDAYPTGALLQNSDSGSVYYVEGGVRHPIVHKSILTERYGGNPPLIQTDSDTLKNYVIGTPLKLPEGSLVISESGEPAVFVISNGERRAISSATTFESLHYSWDDIISVPDSVLRLHPEGPVLSIEQLDTVELTTH